MRNRQVISCLGLVFLPIIANCTSSNETADSPNELAFTDSATSEVAPATIPTTTTTIAPEPIAMGTPEQPFGPIEELKSTKAATTPSGVNLSVLKELENGLLVRSTCDNFRIIDKAKPLQRPHVVIDAGHGGREFGAVGASGLTEKELNLKVAKQTAEILRDRGAKVALTRTGDYSMTVKSRGRLANQLDPALFVSVHHNAGAPLSGDETGTIVFTKNDNTESRRFGGVFYQQMQELLAEGAQKGNDRWQAYEDALNTYEESVAAYDQALAARDAALVANGQLPPEATTSIPPPPEPTGGARQPSQRAPITTTTLPPQAGTLQPVPEMPVPPVSFDQPPVSPFSWSGGGNAGVRSWTNDDGDDYLGVIRHSGDVPAVLTEFLYLTNPDEEWLLSDPTFVEGQALALADSIENWFSDTTAEGAGHIDTQTGSQNIGDGGQKDDCQEPELGF